jgi:hypothetical protein
MFVADNPAASSPSSTASALAEVAGGEPPQVEDGQDLGLQRRHEHPAGSLAGDIVEQGSPVHPVLRPLLIDNPQHRWRLLPPARQCAVVDQAGGYAAGFTGSTIHNFRSYLMDTSLQLNGLPRKVTIFCMRLRCILDSREPGRRRPFARYTARIGGFEPSRA